MSYDPQEKLFVISLLSKPEYGKETKDNVRIQQVEMTWSLKYLAEEKTLVTYQIYIDPKLPIKAINHKMIQDSIFETLVGLRNIVKKPIYTNKKHTKAELKLLVGN